MCNVEIRSTVLASTRGVADVDSRRRHFPHLCPGLKGSYRILARVSKNVKSTCTADGMLPARSKARLFLSNSAKSTVDLSPHHHLPHF